MAELFEWDPAKAAENLTKHGVSFAEATSSFFDPRGLTIDDPSHSLDEHRMVQIGQSHRGRLIVAVHTDRGDRIRIISARLATRRERRRYES